MSSEFSEFGKRWGSRWAEGTILGYVRERIELNRAKGMLRRAMEIIGKDKLSAILKNIEENPHYYLPTIFVEEKIERLKMLKKELNL